MSITFVFIENAFKFPNYILLHCEVLKDILKPLNTSLVLMNDIPEKTIKALK